MANYKFSVKTVNLLKNLLLPFEFLTIPIFDMHHVQKVKIKLQVRYKKSHLISILLVYIRSFDPNRTIQGYP